MTIQGINRCQLLAQVAANPNIDNKYRVSKDSLNNWSNKLERIKNSITYSSSKIQMQEFLNIFEDIAAIYKKAGVSKRLPQSVLIAVFTEGAFSALDPYTVAYWPSQVEAFERLLTNQFPGVGIRFSTAKGAMTIESVLADTPAYYSGIEIGDVIEAVDGISTENMSSNCAVNKITGPEGTKVCLTIRRPQEDATYDFSMQRAKIVVPTVHGWQRNHSGQWNYMLDDESKIGYIRISSFNPRTAGDFSLAFSELISKKMKGLILDLRSNPGGIVTSAVEIADTFITKGLIVRTQPRFGMATYSSAQKENSNPNIPVVILINEHTASAAEILSGCLNDPKHARATLVGSRSYGKGSVQSIVSHIEGVPRLKYTMAYYHMPSGQRVESRSEMQKQGRDDWGVCPDIDVKLYDYQIKQMKEVQKVNCGQMNKSTGAISSIKRYDSTQTIDSDDQLAIGLLVLKARVIQSGYK